jgi:Survival motor neuron (SMN) interacting protein 1 (SIP1)
MAKRKRHEPVKPKTTAGPLNESTGQRPVFPEVVSSSVRDSEWRYADVEAEDEEEVDFGFEEPIGGNDILTSADDAMTDGLELHDGNIEDADEEEEPDEEIEDEEEWQVEPQTEAIAYLHSVRNEAKGLPSLIYVPKETKGVHLQHGTSHSPPDSNSNTECESRWQTQFLQYYYTLRETIANAPEPNLSQDELDELLHINPNYRPEKPDQEDRLWRLKTIDQPSVTLLSMLDHQRTIHLLTHLRKKFSTSVKVEQCMWLVFLLARLGDPGVLSGDELDLLRRIGRKCLVVRGSLEEKYKVILSTVDMVVCIIKYYYQQKDIEEMTQEITSTE